MKIKRREREKKREREMDFSLCGQQTHPQQPPNISRRGLPHMYNDKICVSVELSIQALPLHIPSFCVRAIISSEKGPHPVVVQACTAMV